MDKLAIEDRLQIIKEIAIGGCEDVEVSEKIFDLCDEILGLVDSTSCNRKHNSNSRDNEPCCRCDSGQTNADRIRNMSDEELAEFLDIVGGDGISSQYTNVPCDCCYEKTECSKCWKEWLQSEAE